jgi:protein involved in polysaccharide export with SLBB domain
MNTRDASISQCRRWTGLLLYALFCISCPAGIAAQQIAPQLPRGVTETQVLEQLRQSGMSRAEARQRLTRLGYDPALVDPYFDRLEGRTNQALSVSDQFVQALQAMGMLSSVPRVQLDSLAVPLDSAKTDTLVAVPDSTLQVFGRSIFSSRTTQFAPVAYGPVDPSYQLGPGDEIHLVLTGDVELAYPLEVTREGAIVIPDVGQMFVNGLTLEGLRNTLFDRLGRVYSGIRRSPNATTFFDVSLGRLRVNQVYVIGDVVRPGQLQLSAVSTVFHALQQAGGPSDIGSFRNVLVRRADGGEIDVDLYDYLLRGDASRDVRLQSGDRVFVPPAGTQVFVQGKVRRPAIYEMKEGEGLRDLLAFTGGFDADAYVQRIQIDRVLGLQERIPGVERVILDVNLQDLEDGTVIPLRNGDEVRVFTALLERRNRVSVSGSVVRPGLYEFRGGMTIWDLIRRADGLAEDAFLPVAHVLRPIPQTGTARMLRVSLLTDAQGRAMEDLPLADRDSVIVYQADSLATPAVVEVQGLVKEPGLYRFAEGMTVRDLVMAAGGFQEGAQSYEAEVVRLRQGIERNETIAESRTVALEGDLPARWVPDGADRVGQDGSESGGAFELAHGDRVFVRQMPGFVQPRTVVVNGQLLRPGPYGLELRNERLSSVIDRAGGPTNEAYIAGARLLRDSVLVGIDLIDALEARGGPDDIILQDGDIIIVPRFDPTVLVQGAVAFESRVLYREGMDLQGYLRASGGALSDADIDRASVLYPSGQRATVKKTLGFRRYPSVQPGSTIFIPRATEEQGIDWDSFFTRTLSITTTFITLLLAIERL